MARRSNPRSHKHRHESVTLQLPKNGQLRLAVVADTHSKAHPAAHELIRQQEPDAILHAGDVGAMDVLDELANIAQLIAVRGNIDGVGSLADSIDINVMTGERVRLCLLLMHIALYGPKIRADAARLAGKYGAGLIVCGHSHVPFIGRDRGLAVFNPGSIGPRRFSLPILFGTLIIDESGARMQHISCETREPWSP